MNGEWSSIVVSVALRTSVSFDGKVEVGFVEYRIYEAPKTLSGEKRVENMDQGYLERCTKELFELRMPGAYAWLPR